MTVSRGTEGIVGIKIGIKFIANSCLFIDIDRVSHLTIFLTTMAPRLKQSDPGPVALRAEVEKLWQKYKGDLSQYPNPALIYNQSEIKRVFQIYGNKWENKAANQYRNYIKEKFLQNGMFQVIHITHHDELIIIIGLGLTS
jgi:hypothetical protein